MEKKVFIKTWGCQMNVYDSARIADVAGSLGYSVCEGPDDADLIIFNTCHIREKASEKIYSDLGRLRPLKEKAIKKGRTILIVVAGCVAQAEGEELQRRAPYVDIVVGPQAYHRLPEMIEKAMEGKNRAVDIDFPPHSKFDYLPEMSFGTAVSSFLTIQEGCDRFCSYCVVPYTRGAEYARPLSEIVNEAKLLIAKGAKEITLLGQNVNAWHDGEKGLGNLIRTLAEIPELKRLRYTTSHPLSMTDDLISAHRDVPKLMPFLHLPVQSGSDKILDAMNRKHTADDYRRLVDKLRSARPDIALSSDFIVGFPGETDKDFEATLKLVRDIGFSQAYTFKYSRRPGTPAAAMPNQITEKVKKERLQELQSVLGEQQQKFNSLFVGKAVPVLLEKASVKGSYVFGRSPFWQVVRSRGQADMLGKEVMVEITSSCKTGLAGKICETF